MIQTYAIGRLVKDIELKEVKKKEGTGVVANFTLACRDEKETIFMDCTLWNEGAKTLAEHTQKDIKSLCLVNLNSVNGKKKELKLNNEKHLY